MPCCNDRQHGLGRAPSSQKEFLSVNAIRTAFLVLLTLASGARAQLLFDSKSVEKTANWDDTQLVAEFPFHNIGTHPVKILRVKPSCDCTVASLEKDTVAPGSAGTIKVTFNLGNRRGTEIKTIAILTDDHTHSDTVLRLVATIPELMRLEPALVFWRIGEKPEPKQITIHAASSIPIPDITVSSTDPSFKTELRSVTEGREYIVTVTPKSTATSSKTEIQLTSSFKQYRGGISKAYAHVKQ
jgi:hypothetical protein